MTHETKKMDMSTIMVVLLGLNLLLLVYVSFFKHDALWLETMKSGGKGNFANAQKIWNSEMFKTTQAQGIQQALASIEQQANPLAQPTTETAPAAAQATTETAPAAK